MADLESFYPEWKSLLEKKGIEGRPSSLLLEMVLQTEGIKGVEKLLRTGSMNFANKSTTGTRLSNGKSGQ